MSQNALPIVKKCLLCIDLKIGVLMYISFEMAIWLFLSWAAVDNETEFFLNYDLYKFEEHIEDNWYYQMIFGLPVSDGEDYDYDYGLESAAEDSDGIDIEYRFQNIAINGLIMLVFISYFILSFIFIIGIGKKNPYFFIPYIIFDFFTIWMSFILIFGGLFMVNFILIRNCSIFSSVKLYPAICNYSLFKKLGGKFAFTRETPTVDPNEVESRRQSANARRKDKKAAEEFELEELNKHNSNGIMPEVRVVKDRR